MIHCIYLQLKDQEKESGEQELKAVIEQLQEKLTNQEQEFESERAGLEESIREQLEKQYQQRESHLKEESEGLAKEWEIERRVSTSICLLVDRNLFIYFFGKELLL